MLYIGGSDTYRSYHCFSHSLYLWLWLQKWSVLAQLEKGAQRQLLHKLQLFCLTCMMQGVIPHATVTGEVTAQLSPARMYVVTHLTINWVESLQYFLCIKKPVSWVKLKIRHLCLVWTENTCRWKGVQMTTMAWLLIPCQSRGSVLTSHTNRASALCLRSCAIITTQY